MAKGRAVVLAAAILLVCLCVGLLVWLLTLCSVLREPSDTLDRPEPARGVQAVEKPRRLTPAESAATATLAARVLRRLDESPAIGAAVRLRTRDGAELAAETGADGRFLLTRIASGTALDLSVDASEFAPLRLTLPALQAGDERDLGVLWLDASVRTLIDVRSLLDRAPIEGALVEAFAAEGPATQLSHADRIRLIATTPTAAHTAATNARGRAVFPAVPIGSWVFRASRAGFATTCSRNNATGGVKRALAAGQGEATFTIWLRPAHSLTGRVIDEDGAPYERAVVVASPPIGFGHLFDSLRATTDASGTYAIRGLARGGHRLSVAPGGGRTVAAMTVEVPVGGPFDLVIPRGGVLFGRVTDAATGTPIDDALVRAGDSGFFRVGESRTDADGRYRIGTLPPCAVARVTVEKAGYATAAPAVDDTPLPAGITRTEHGSRDGRRVLEIPLRGGAEFELDVTLHRGARVEGVVRGPDGSVGYASVHPIQLAARDGVDVRPVTADEHGRYAFEDLRPGRIVLRAAKDGWWSPDFPPGMGWRDALGGDATWARVTVEVPADGVVEKDLRLARATPVSGTVAGPDGKPVAGAVVAWLQETYSAGLHRIAASDDGTFVLPGVAPDARLAIWAEHPEFYAAGSVRMKAPGAAPVADVFLRLVERARVVGSVRCAAGHDLRGATARAWGSMGPEDAGGRAVNDGSGAVPLGADGTFEIAIPGTPEGNFRVRIDAPGHRSAEAGPWSVTPGRVTQVDLVLEEFTPIRGLAVTTGGGPVAGARIGIGNYGSTTAALTDAEGRFQLVDFGGHWGFGGTKFWLWAAASGHEPTRVQVTPENRSEVLFELEPTMSISGTLRTQDGTPVGGAIVSVRRSGGAGPAFAFTGHRFAGEALSAPDGTFTIRDLPAGHYTLAARMPAGSETGLVPHLSPTVEAGQSDVDVRVLAAEGAGFTGPHAALATEELGQLARVEAMRREHETAVELWRELLERPLTPQEESEARLALATSLGALDRPEEQLTVLREAHGAAPEGSAERVQATAALLGLLANDPGARDEAFALINEQIDSGDRSPTSAAYARYLRALLLDREGASAEALREAEALAEEMPEEPAYSGIWGALRGLLTRLRAKTR